MKTKLAYIILLVCFFFPFKGVLATTTDVIQPHDVVYAGSGWWRYGYIWSYPNGNDSWNGQGSCVGYTYPAVDPTEECRQIEEFDFSTISSGDTATSAVIRFPGYVTLHDGGAYGVRVVRIKKAIHLDQGPGWINWDDIGSAWGSLGAKSPGVDYYDDTLGTGDLTTAGTGKSITLDPTKIQAFFGNASVGIMLYTPTMSGSADYGSGNGNAAIITVVHSSTPPTPTPTNTPTPTPTPGPFLTPSPFPNSPAPSQVNANLITYVKLSTVSGQMYGYTAKIVVNNKTDLQYTTYSCNKEGYSSTDTAHTHCINMGSPVFVGVHEIHTLETSVPFFYVPGQTFTMWYWSYDNYSWTPSYTVFGDYETFTPGNPPSSNSPFVPPDVPASCDSLDLFCQFKAWTYNALGYVFGFSADFASVKFDEVKTQLNSKVPFIYLATIQNSDFGSQEGTPGAIPDFTFNLIPKLKVSGSMVSEPTVPIVISGSQLSVILPLATAIRNVFKIFLWVAFVFGIIKSWRGLF